MIPTIPYTRRTLPCGLDVIVHRDNTAPQVCTAVWYRVGSSDERADRTGFAHLFEHLFKNSEHMPSHHYDVLRRAGASEANASTGTDRTAYHEVVPANELPLALWLEADRMGYFWPGMTSDRLAVQQSVVRAERRQRYEAVPYGPERFACALALYPDGHPLRHHGTGHQVATELREHHALGHRADLVPGPADPLQPGRHRRRRLDLHHEVDRAHVDAQLQRGRGHHARQPTRLELFLHQGALIP